MQTEKVKAPPPAPYRQTVETGDGKYHLHKDQDPHPFLMLTGVNNAVLFTTCLY